MESSQRVHFIEMIVDRFILKNNQITLFPCFTFIPKTGEGLKQGLIFTLLKSKCTSLLDRHVGHCVMYSL